MIPLWVAILLMFLGAIIGVLVAAIFAASGKSDEIVEEIMDNEKKLDMIEEVFSKYGDCEHDVEGPSADYDGHHFISYSIDKKGKEKILEAL
ncbi:MAG TPA: hypothetical protein ENI23_04425 [bacterium]|nr:hypothetical protein [bacterium]